MNIRATRKLIRLLNTQTTTGTFDEPHWEKPNTKPFYWDFGTISEFCNCQTNGCAIGLAYWARMIPDLSLESLATILDLDHHTAHKIFMSSLFYPDTKDYTEITPKMVSRKLEELLILQEAESL